MNNSNSSASEKAPATDPQLPPIPDGLLIAPVGPSNIPGAPTAPEQGQPAGAAAVPPPPKEPWPERLKKHKAAATKLDAAYQSQIATQVFALMEPVKCISSASPTVFRSISDILRKYEDTNRRTRNPKFEEDISALCELLGDWMHSHAETWPEDDYPFILWFLLHLAGYQPFLRDERPAIFRDVEDMVKNGIARFFKEYSSFHVLKQCSKSNNALFSALQSMLKDATLHQHLCYLPMLRDFKFFWHLTIFSMQLKKLSDNTRGCSEDFKNFWEGASRRIPPSEWPDLVQLLNTHVQALVDSHFTNLMFMVVFGKLRAPVQPDHLRLLIEAYPYDFYSEDNMKTIANHVRDWTTDLTQLEAWARVLAFVARFTCDHQCDRPPLSLPEVVTRLFTPLMNKVNNLPGADISALMNLIIEAFRIEDRGFVTAIVKKSMQAAASEITPEKFCKSLPVAEATLQDYFTNYVSKCVTVGLNSSGASGLLTLVPLFDTFFADLTRTAAISAPAPPSGGASGKQPADAPPPPSAPASSAAAAALKPLVGFDAYIALLRTIEDTLSKAVVSPYLMYLFSSGVAGIVSDVLILLLKCKQYCPSVDDHRLTERLKSAFQAIVRAFQGRATSRDLLKRYVMRTLSDEEGKWTKEHADSPALPPLYVAACDALSGVIIEGLLWKGSANTSEKVEDISHFLLSQFCDQVYESMFGNTFWGGYNMSNKNTFGTGGTTYGGYSSPWTNTGTSNSSTGGWWNGGWTSGGTTYGGGYTTYSYQSAIDSNYTLANNNLLITRTFIRGLDECLTPLAACPFRARHEVKSWLVLEKHVDDKGYKEHEPSVAELKVLAGKLRDCLKDASKRIHERALSEADSALAQKNIKDLNALWKLVGLEDKDKPNIEAVVAEFADVKLLYRELVQVKNWMQVKNVAQAAALSAVRATIREDMTLADMKVTSEELQAAFGLHPETLDRLRFFLSRNSLFFEATVQKHMSSLLEKNVKKAKEEALAAQAAAAAAAIAALPFPAAPAPAPAPAAPPVPDQPGSVVENLMAELRQQAAAMGLNLQFGGPQQPAPAAPEGAAAAVAAPAPAPVPVQLPPPEPEVLPFLTTQDVETLIDLTTQFLNKLLDDDEIELSELDAVEELNRKLRRNFKREMDVISEFLGRTARKGPEVEQRLARLAVAMELVQFRSVINTMFSTLNQYKMSCVNEPAMDQIRTLFAALEKNVKFSEVPDLAADLRAGLGGLTVTQMKYFEPLVHAQDLIAFLKNENDFIGRVAFLTQQLQGNEFANRVLTDLQVARRILDPVIAGVGSFRSLVSHISSMFPDEASIAQLEAIRTSSDNMTWIQLWFSRTSGLHSDTLLPFIACLMETGTFRSRLRGHALSAEGASSLTALSLMYTVDGKENALQHDQLEDIVRGAIFCNSDTSLAEDQKTQMREFVQIHALAHECHALRLRLESSGHPDFQGTVDSLTPKMESGLFRALKSSLTAQLSAWQENTEREYQRNPRLLFLDRRQALHVMTHISAHPKVDVSSLLPFLSACFPDLGKVPVPKDKQDLGKTHAITVEMVCEALRTICDPNAAAGGPDAPGPAQEKKEKEKDDQEPRAPPRFTMDLQGVEFSVVEWEKTSGSGMGWSGPTAPLTNMQALEELPGFGFFDDEESSQSQPPPQQSQGRSWFDFGSQEAPFPFADAEFISSQLSDGSAQGLPSVPARVFEYRVTGNTLQAAGYLITALERILEESDMLCVGSPSLLLGSAGASQTTVVTCFGQNEDTLLRLMVQTFDFDAPHPSQVLWCHPDITPDEVRALLLRPVKFPHLKFAIVGVNHLSLACREEVLKNQSEIFLSRTATPVGPTFLVFTDNVGVEVFSFLRIEARNSENIMTELNLMKDTPTMTTMLEKRGIKRFECVGGVGAGNGKSHYIRTELDAAGVPPQWRLSLTVHEDFSTLFFLEKFRSWFAGFDRAPKEIGLFLNISPYAPFPLLSKFLFNFIMCGVFWDHESGDMCVPPPETSWTVFVEIPEPPTKGTAYSTEDAMVAALPVVKYLASRPRYRIQAAPYQMDDDSSLVCAFLDLMLQRTLDNTNLSALQPLRVSARVQELLAFLWEKRCPNVPKTKLYRRMHIQLLAERCHFLKSLYKHTQSMRSRGYQDQFTETKGLYSKAFDVFLDECSHLVDRDLRQDWARFPHAYTTRACTSEYAVLNILQLSASNETEATARSRDLPALDGTTVELIPGLLRAALAPGMGLLDTSRMLRAIDSAGYVLTKDFAIKLLILNERRKVGFNVIFQGDTGVGKTELLRVYSEIMNLNSSLVPIMGFSLWDFLTSLAAQNSIYAKLKTRWPQTTEAMLTSVREVCEETAVFAEFSPKFIAWANDMFASYPLLHRAAFAEDVLREGTVQNVDELLKFAGEVVSARPKQLFHKILMHERITAADWRRTIRDIIDKAEELAAFDKNINITVFVDELNTSYVLGMVSEVFSDHTLDGEPIPKNIFFVGAINPYVESKGQGADYTQSLTGQSSGGSSSAAPSSAPSTAPQTEFLVRPVPPSMSELILNFDSLSTEQESAFLISLLTQKIGDDELNADARRNQIHMLALMSQDFVRSAHIPRVHVSIRDMCRCVDLYRFFKDRNESGSILSPPDAARDTDGHWKALLMALTMTYYFRLPTTFVASSGDHAGKQRHLRTEFEQMIQSFVGDTFRESCPYTFTALVAHELSYLCSRTEIPVGIATTRALQENLFCNVVCLQTRTPLIITGPPGSSKTLSFNIAADNMKGTRSTKPAYQELHNVHRFPYQCSEESTASEIESVFLSAAERQNRFEKARMLKERTVVFLDEAGLPEERKHAMKVIHYYLDHPSVACVILSNSTLDAAKTNRAVQLLQADTSFEDLYALAEGCLLSASSHDPTPREKAIVKGLCSAFQRVNEFADTRASLFHLRDFVYLLRYLRRHGSVALSHAEEEGGAEAELVSHDVAFTSEVLVRGLRRNFNGISATAFDGLVRMFFSEINSHGGLLLEPPSVIDTTVLPVLREAINDRLKPGQDPNHAAFRYILVFDPTEIQSSVSLLFGLGILDRSTTHICYLSDFENDRNERVRSQVISDVKSAMELGHTVVMINAQSIFTSFYDVFNRHFSSVMGSGEKSKVQHYANVAIGSFSRPCAVHPNFQIIVHLPMSGLPKAPLPFLNRFEKYILSMDHALHESMRLNPWPVVAAGKTMFELITEGVSDFIERLAPSSFYGHVTKETVASLILSIVENSIKLRSQIPQIPRPFAVGVGASSPSSDLHEEILFEDTAASAAAPSAGGSASAPTATPTKSANRSETAESPLVAQVREYIRRANFLMLQAARPEAVFLQRKALPQEYINEYISNQEHLSIVRFFHALLLSHFDVKPQDVPDQPEDGPIEDTQTAQETKKWIICTRTSGELFRLHADHSLQQLLLRPLKPQASADGSGEGSEGTSNEWCSKLMRVVNLSSFSSSVDCQTAVREFTKSDTHRILLCVADMRSVTRSQLNYLRNCIDESLDQWNAQARASPAESSDSVAPTPSRSAVKPPLVVLVVHFPPEWLQIRSVYDCVTFAGWDFTYIDSLGAVQSQQQQDEENAGGVSEGVREAADARKWMGMSFGLIQKPSLHEIVSEFHETFRTTVRKTAEKLMITAPAQAPGLIITRDFYARTKNIAAFLENFFQQHGYLREEILRKFASSWTPAHLDTLIHQACQAVQAGRSIGSLLDVICLSLEQHLVGVVGILLRATARNYNLETIARVGRMPSSDPAKAKLEKVARAALRMIRVPALAESSSVFSEMNVMIDADARRPPLLPYFDFIAQTLIALTNTASRTLVRQARTKDALYRELEGIVAQDRKVSEVLSIIESDPALLDQFKRDFITRTLRHADLYDAELSLFSTIVDSLSCDPNRIASLFVVHKYDTDNLGVLKAQLVQLRDITDDTSALSFDACTEYAHFLAEIHRFSANALWDSLLSCLQSEDAVSACYSMQSWINNFRSFHSKAGSRVALLSSLNTSSLKRRVDTMLALYHFVVNFADSAKDSKDGVDLMPILMVFREALGETGATAPSADSRSHHGLEDMLPLLSAMWTALPKYANKTSEKHVKALEYFLESLLETFLGSADATSASTRDHLEPRDLELLLSLVNETRDQTMWRHLPLPVRVRLLRPLLAKKGEEGRVLHQLVGRELMRGGIPDPTKYTYSAANVRALAESVSETPSHSAGVQPLEDLFFYALMEDRKSNAASGTSSCSSLDELCTAFHESDPTRSRTPEERISDAIAHSVDGVVLCDRTARLMCDEQVPVDKITETWSEMAKTTVRELLAHSDQHQLYLLHEVRPQARLIDVMKCKETLAVMGLDKWKLDIDVNFEGFHNFPFMLDQSSPHGKEYAALRQAIGDCDEATFRGLLSQLPSSQDMRFRFRMYLILILYYGYFNNDRECLFVKSLLNEPSLAAALDLTPLELPFYLYFASRPQEASAQRFDDLKRFFSTHPTVRAEDTVRHLMVNTLAITLGLPRTATHFYTRTFEPEQLQNSRGVGSAYSRTTADCGYQMDEKGNLTNPSGYEIYGGSRLFRLASNFLTWSAMTMGLLVHGQKHFPHVSRLTTYFREDSRFVTQSQTLQRDDHDALAFYCLARVNVFYTWMCIDQNLASRNVEGPFFVTQALHQFWTHIHAKCPGSEVARSVFPSEKEVTAYETLIKSSAFDPVLKNHGELKATYQSALLSLEGFGVLLKVGAVGDGSSGAICLKSYDIFDQALSSVNDRKLIKEFKDKRNRLHSMANLPVFIEFYQLLHSTFDHRFTEEEAMSLTVPEAIQTLVGAESEAQIDYLKDMFAKFQKAWEETREKLQQFIMCRHAQAVEGEIGVVNETTLFGSLVSWADVRINDEIMRMVDEAIRQQNEFLAIVYDATRSSPSHRLLCDFDAKEYPIQFLSRDANAMNVLITADRSGEFVDFVSAHAVTETKASSSGSSSSKEQTETFDWNAIEKHILERYVSGRVQLSTSLSLRRVFNFRQQGQQGGKAAEVSHFGIQQLHQAASSLPAELGEDLPVTDRRRLDLCLQRKSEQELLQLADTMSQICNHVAGSVVLNALPGLDQPLEEIAQSAAIPPTGIFEKIQNFRARHLASTCLAIVEKYWEKDFLFSDLGTELNIPLPPKVQADLTQLLDKVPESGREISKKLSVLQSIANVLLDREHQSLLIAHLREPLRNLLAPSLRVSRVSEEDLELFFPREVCAENFSPYLRCVQRGCGRLLLTMTQNGEKYTELCSITE